MDVTLVKFVDMPEESEEFKIVQLYFKDEPYLLCRVKESDGNLNYYHEKILRSFLSNQGLEANVDYVLIKPKPDSFFQIPPLELPGIYRVVGAGFASINSKNYEFQLPYGSSVDYSKLGIGIDKDFNELIKKTFLAESSEWFKSKPQEEFPLEVRNLLNKLQNNK